MFKLVHGCKAAKSSDATLTKLCSNKGYVVTNVIGKFYSGLQCSFCIMINSLNISRFGCLERLTV